MCIRDSHCWAYVIGRNPAAERMSDDGEPAGTAGKPILEVLRGKKLTDVFVVVTRYFGGTLLGTGGLVRAYTSAAAEALAHTVIITKIHGFKLKIITDYTGLGKIQYILGQRGLSVLDTVYTDKVELTVLVPDDEEGFLMKELMEGTNGQAMTEKTEQMCIRDRLTFRLYFTEHQVSEMKILRKRSLLESLRSIYIQNYARLLWKRSTNIKTSRSWLWNVR